MKTAATVTQFVKLAAAVIILNISSYAAIFIIAYVKDYEITINSLNDPMQTVCRNALSANTAVQDFVVKSEKLTSLSAQLKEMSTSPDESLNKFRI